MNHFVVKSQAVGAMWRAEVAFAERFVAEAPDLGLVGDDPSAWPHLPHLPHDPP